MHRGARGKKLKAAAKLWLAPDLRAAAKAVDNDLKALGAPDSVLAARAEQQYDDQPFVVHSDNVPAFRLFAAMQTQWRWVTAAHTPHRVGFDYSVLPVVASAVGVKVKKNNFAKLQVLEAVALDVFRKREERRNQ